MTRLTEYKSFGSGRGVHNICLSDEITIAFYTSKLTIIVMNIKYKYTYVCILYITSRLPIPILYLHNLINKYIIMNVNLSVIYREKLREGTRK